MKWEKPDRNMSAGSTWLYVLYLWYRDICIFMCLRVLVYLSDLKRTRCTLSHRPHHDWVILCMTACTLSCRVYLTTCSLLLDLYLNLINSGAPAGLLFGQNRQGRQGPDCRLDRLHLMFRYASITICVTRARMWTFVWAWLTRCDVFLIIWPSGKHLVYT